METMILRAILAFVSSVAVISIKTFLVVSFILLCSPLISGGKDSTVPF